MAYKRISPGPVVEGYTGKQSFTAYAVITGGTTSTGALQNTVGAGTAGQLLVSGGAAALPVWTAASSASSITLTGDTGGALTSNSFTLTAGTTGLSFGGAGTTETLSGTLIVSNGGTGRTTLTAHDLLIGNGTTAVTLLAPSATSGIPLISQGVASDPVFGAAVVAGGGTGATTFNINGAVFSGTTTTSALSAATLTSGQLLIGGTTTPAAASLTAGAGIAITTGNNSISIAAIGAGTTWSVITADQTAAVENGYFCNKAGTLALALPAASVIGDIIRVTNENTALGVQFTQTAGQQILIGNTNTTSGATGTLTSSAVGDCLTIVCKTANTVWRVIEIVGNWSVV